MLFEFVSRVYFSHGITCVAVWLVAVSDDSRLSVQGSFLKETRFCGQCKTTRRNQIAKKGIIMHRDAKEIINVKIRDNI